EATDLVPDDTNQVADAFVRDLVTGSTERVSVADDGTQADDASSGAAISADRRYVVCLSVAGNLTADGRRGFLSLYLRDRVAGTTELVTDRVVGGFRDRSAAISADGRYIAYSASAPAPHSGVSVHVYDRRTG